MPWCGDQRYNELPKSLQHAKLWLRRSAWAGSPGDFGHSIQALVAVLELMATSCVIPKFPFGPAEGPQPYSAPCWTEPVPSPAVMAAFSSDLHPILLEPLSLPCGKQCARLVGQVELAAFPISPQCLPVAELQTL